MVPDRILIYGVTGSGKTTLAAGIAAQTGLPWHSVDDLTWEPGWAQVPVKEQRRRVAAICAGDRWILDTAYSQWLDVPFARVQLVVALDYPRWLSLGRLLRRTLIARRGPPSDLQRQHGVISGDVLERLDLGMALSLFRPQTCSHPRLDHGPVWPRCRPAHVCARHSGLARTVGFWLSRATYAGHFATRLGEGLLEAVA